MQVANCITCGEYDDVTSSAKPNVRRQQLEITLKQKYAANTNASLKIAFKGKLSEDLHGFYKSSYNSGDR